MVSDSTYPFCSSCWASARTSAVAEASISSLSSNARSGSVEVRATNRPVPISITEAAGVGCISDLVVSSKSVFTASNLPGCCVAVLLSKARNSVRPIVSSGGIDRKSGVSGIIPMSINASPMANARLLSSEMEPSLISDNDVGRIITLSISLSLARAETLTSPMANKAPIVNFRIFVAACFNNPFIAIRPCVYFLICSH